MVDIGKSHENRGWFMRQLLRQLVIRNELEVDSWVYTDDNHGWVRKLLQIMGNQIIELDEAKRYTVRSFTVIYSYVSWLFFCSLWHQIDETKILYIHTYI